MNTIADSAPRNPACAPTERSICPATITSTIPIARMAVMDICRASSERLRGVKNVPSVRTENTTQMTRRAPTIVSARQGMAERRVALGASSVMPPPSPLP